MADPPRPSRQPPPLPPLPFRTIEPEPPEVERVDEEEPAPDTKRSGRARRDETYPPAVDPLTETSAVMLRRELVLLREALPTLPGASVPVLPMLPGSIPPVSIRTRTKRELAAQISKGGGKWTLLVGLAAVALPIAAKKFPAYADIITAIQGWLP